MERTGRAVSFASRVMVLLAAASLFFCGMLMLGAAEAKAYVSFDGVEVLYDGSPHAIAVSGVDESTEVYYSTTTSLNVYNYEQFGTTVKPSRTAAGSTLVYAFAKGKAGSTGSGSAYINIKPRVSAPDQTFYYDGNSHAATVKAEGGATVYYSTYRSLTYSNYKSYGSTSAPTFTNVASPSRTQAITSGATARPAPSTSTGPSPRPPSPMRPPQLFRRTPTVGRPVRLLPRSRWATRPLPRARTIP